MMAPGHAFVASTAGGYTALVFAAPWQVTVLAALALGGAALVCDLCHHGSTVTESFGRVSHAAHRGTVRLHNLVADLTHDPGERDPAPHRGITHWWPTPLLVGVLVGVPCVLTPWAAWPVLTVLTYLAILGITVPEYRDDPEMDPRRKAGRAAAHFVAGLVPTIAVLKLFRRSTRRRRKVSSVWLVRVLLRRESNDMIITRIVKAILRPVLGVVTVRLVVFAGCAALAGWVLRGEPRLAWFVGPLLTVGMFLHMLTDAPTWSRIPGWTLRGYFRWPRCLSFYAGGAFEVGVVWTLMSIAGGVGLWLTVWPELAGLWDAGHGAVEALK